MERAEDTRLWVESSGSANETIELGEVNNNPVPTRSPETASHSGNGNAASLPLPPSNGGSDHANPEFGSSLRSSERHGTTERQSVSSIQARAENRGFPVPTPIASETIISPWRNKDYFQYVQQLTRSFPQLNILLQRARHDLIDISVTDVREGCPTTQSFITNNFMNADDKSKTCRDLSDYLSLPMDCSIERRIILVQDLGKASIRILGESLDLQPEFFAEHLYNATYNRSSNVGSKKTSRFEIWPDTPIRSSDLYPFERDLSFQSYDRPSKWNTGGMQKTYRSMIWYRPVMRESLPASPFRRQPPMWLFNALKSDSASNIFRPHWQLQVQREGDDLPTELESAAKFSLWEERMSFCEIEIESCITSK